MPSQAFFDYNERYSLKVIISSSFRIFFHAWYLFLFFPPFGFADVNDTREEFKASILDRRKQNITNFLKKRNMLNKRRSSA